MGKIPILRPSTAEITVEERGPAVPTSTNTALPLPSVDGDQDVSAEDAVKGEAGSEELPIEPPDDTLDLDEE